MTSRPQLILGLLVVSLMINYLDRGALSVSAPVLARELSLGPAELGWLLSAFFWSYALCQIGAGWLVDRYDVKWVYAAGFAIWSLATAATGFVSGFGALVAARLVLGIGESIAYPACSRLVAANFPEHRRGLANALIDAGSKLGPGLSTLFGGLAVAAFGWRALFIVIGLGSLFWLLPWMLSVPRSQPGKAAASAALVSFPELLGKRQLWVTSVNLFAVGYVWYFLITWLPSYLVTARGLSMQTMSVYGAIPFFLMAAASTLGGWLSDTWIARGGAVTRVRPTIAIAGFVCCAASMIPAALVAEPMHSVAWIGAASFALGIHTSQVWAVTQTLAGPAAAGKWTGVQNCIGNFGGVASPLVTGWLVAGTGSFVYPFLVTAAVIATGCLCYAVLLGPIVPVEWRSLEQQTPARDA